MKRIECGLLSILVLAVLLAGCHAQPVTTETTAAVTEFVLNIDKLVGPWHLAKETDAIFDAFPGAMEFGSMMEIRSDGRIAWFLGAEGGVGTYTMDGNVLHCELMNALDGNPMTMDFTAETRDGQTYLTTTYHDTALCWRWGEE